MIGRKYRLCPECETARAAAQFFWARDRYGIATTKVCGDCLEQVEDRLMGWEFAHGPSLWTPPSDPSKPLTPEDFL